MSEALGSASGRSTRAGRGLVFGGLGAALLGHVLAAVAVPFVVWRMGGYSNIDLEAGGRFAVNFEALRTFIFAHTVLGLAILVASAFFAFFRRRLSLGLLIGWAGGWVLNVTALFLGMAVWWPPLLQGKGWDVVGQWEDLLVGQL